MASFPQIWALPEFFRGCAYASSLTLRPWGSSPPLCSHCLDPGSDLYCTPGADWAGSRGNNTQRGLRPCGAPSQTPSSSRTWQWPFQLSRVYTSTPGVLTLFTTRDPRYSLLHLADSQKVFKLKWSPFPRSLPRCSQQGQWSCTRSEHQTVSGMTQQAKNEINWGFNYSLQRCKRLRPEKTSPLPVACFPMEQCSGGEAVGSVQTRGSLTIEGVPDERLWQFYRY